VIDKPLKEESMSKKTLLAILTLMLVAGFAACHAGPGAATSDLGSDTQITSGLDTIVESGESGTVSVEADKSSLFNAINADVDAAIVFGSAHKDLIKSTLQASIDPAKWNDAKPLFTDFDIVEMAAVWRKDVFGDEPLLFIKFAEPLSSTESTAFDTFATNSNWGKLTYDFDGDGQPDENLYVTYKSTLTVTSGDVDKFLIKPDETGDRVNCLNGVDNVPALMGCGYIHKEVLKKMFDFPAYDSSKAVAWFHLFADETLVLDAKLLDDDKQVSSFEWSLDEESSFSKNFFKKLFD
jgi:hypothetical protein